MTQARRPSPLQRRVLIVLAALDAKRPGPVATRDIERVLEQGGDALRAPNLQLAVELTEDGRGIAEPLFQAEREAETARQRLTDVRRLPLRQTAAGDAVELQLDDGHYTIREAAYVIRLDGTTCLQLTDAGGIRRIKEGDPLQVASWYQACFDAGLPVTVQVNESRD